MLNITLFIIKVNTNKGYKCSFTNTRINFRTIIQAPFQNRINIPLQKLTILTILDTTIHLKTVLKLNETRITNTIRNIFIVNIKKRGGHPVA
jgi:hypothetical protein